MANPAQWYGLKYPDSDLVGLLFRHARPPGPEALAVDVGCGAGRHVRLLEELGYKAIGIDRDAEMAAAARRNGLDAHQADASDFRPAARPHLVVAWGLVMLVADAPALLARWQPTLIVMDWRSENNDCARWPDNEPADDGAILMHRPGHVLDGQRYFFHTLDRCEVPGYERIAWQRVTRHARGETNEWYQTVHRRQE